jgi:hypothetical protein
LNPRCPGGYYVNYISKLYGNNLVYDEILIELGIKPYMNEESLMMIKPKKEICENDVFSHTLDNEAIGSILLNNTDFRIDLKRFKKLNYTFNWNDFSVMNGTKEQDI